jgi:excisionase family DNA binding protein
MQIPFEEIIERLIRIEAILNKIQNTAKEKPTEDKLLSANEAAEYLKVAKQTLYGYVFRKQIPVMKMGGKLYFSQKELTELIFKGRRLTNNERRGI